MDLENQFVTETLRALVPPEPPKSNLSSSEEWKHLEKVGESKRE